MQDTLKLQDLETHTKLLMCKMLIRTLIEKKYNKYINTLTDLFTQNF